jgi:type VI secretion system secreted protein Hcp
MRQVKRLVVAVAAIVFISASFASAAGNAIMVGVNGTKQGQFKGESTRAQAQDKLEAMGFTFEVASPRDAASGLASGKRQYKPLTITKAIGASSPQFLQALATNEVLKTVTLDFFKTNESGEEYIYYTIKLTNATVASIRQHSPETGGAAASKSAAGAMPQLEEISFTFQRIEVESKDGKTMAVDDWSVAR